MRISVLLFIFVFSCLCYAKQTGIRNADILRYYIGRYHNNLEEIRTDIENAKTREDALKLVERARKRVNASASIPQSFIPYNILKAEK